MRISLLSLAAALALGLAAAPIAAAQSKIGVVDYRRLIAESPQAREAQSTLENEFGPRQRQLQAQAKEFEAKGQKFERDQATMSDSERARTQKELRDTQIALERRNKELQEDADLRKNEELQKVQRAIVEEVQKLAKAQGYDLVLAEGVIYRADAIDITAPVLATLQAKAPKTAANAPAAAKPAGSTKN
jgi:outer membrane protein